MEEQLSPSESLKLITKMISQTRENLKLQGFYYLIWGWLVIIAALSNYIISQFTDFEYHYIPWIILMPIGVVISIVYGIKNNNKKEYITHLEVFLKTLWIVLLFTFFIATFIAIYLDISPSIHILLICGIGALVSGITLKFRPLIFGGVVFQIAAIACMYFDDATSLLITAIAMIIGYLVPAYTLKKSKQ